MTRTPIETRIRKVGADTHDGLLRCIFLVDGRGTDGRWYPHTAHPTLAEAMAADRKIPGTWEEVA